MKHLILDTDIGGDVDDAMPIFSSARARKKSEGRRSVAACGHHELRAHPVADDGVGGRGRLDGKRCEPWIERRRGAHAFALLLELRFVRKLDQRTARTCVRVGARNAGRHDYTSEGAKSPPSRRSLGAGSWLRRKVRL